MPKKRRKSPETVLCKVIAVRVPLPFYDEIKTEAKKRGHTVADELRRLIEQTKTKNDQTVVTGN
jgi:hypothetical protein